MRVLRGRATAPARRRHGKRSISSPERKIAQYIQAAQRGADWIEARQHADGAIDPQGGISSIYKTVFALVTAGRLNAAWRLMDYIDQHLTSSPGQFAAPNEDDLEHPASPFYRNCYIVKAALRLGRFDVASPMALEYVYRQQHPNGGFLGGKPSESREIDPLYTAMGGWLCLYTARMEQAGRAGNFLLNLIAMQPEWPHRFYFKVNTETGRCITEFDPDTGISYFADKSRDRQHFYYAGAIMGFLADLYRATKEIRFLEGARTMFAFELGMKPRSFRWPSKCKVGWGAALLYSVTGDPAHRKMAERVADETFLKSQRADGSWDEFLFPLRDDYSGALASALEVTAEFTFELCEIAKALGR